jgi:hypothetical protein
MMIFSISTSNPAWAGNSRIEFIGEAILSLGAEVGGLSGITYDTKNDLYYAISDDRGAKGSTRFYTFRIDLSKGKLSKKDVVLVEVTKLLDQHSQPFLPGTTDTEGIAVTNRETIFISSEGDPQKLINPFIQEFSLSSGKVAKNLPIPDKFLPDPTHQRGIRNNLAFESLTITPDQKTLVTATENALIQDGIAAKPGIGSNCRILQYNLLTNQPEKEFLYQTEPITPVFNLTGKFASGLTDLFILDNYGKFLSIERSFNGWGFTILLFENSWQNADDIHTIDSLVAIDLQKIKPVTKKLLLDLGALNLSLDNIEGFTVGGNLPNGESSLILLSDNNFNGLQRTQVLAFKFKDSRIYTE